MITSVLNKIKAQECSKTHKNKINTYKKFSTVQLK